MVPSQKTHPYGCFLSKGSKDHRSWLDIAAHMFALLFQWFWTSPFDPKLSEVAFGRALLRGEIDGSLRGKLLQKRLQLVRTSEMSEHCVGSQPSGGLLLAKDPPRKIEEDEPDEQVIEVDFLPC